MIPIDKFGKPIFPSKYKLLQQNGAVLVSKGYFESKRKPNLFCKKLSQGWVYANMQGTEEVPIWSDTRPLFHWNFDKSVPMWERRRIIKVELRALLEAGCGCRLSFHAHDSPEFVEVSSYVDEEEGIFDWDDGFCRFCRTDFSEDGSFCSDKCEKEYKDSLKTPCDVCGKKIEFMKEIRHHISYFPEKVIFVHIGCHNKIHKTDEFPHLKPSEGEIRRFYSESSVARPD